MNEDQESRLLSKLERLLKTGRSSTSEYIADELERFYQQKLEGMDPGDLDPERLATRLEIIRKIGDVNIMMGRRERADSYYNEVLKLAPRSSSAASIHRRYGDDEKRMANWAQAAQHYERALAIWTENKDELGMAIALRSIGYISWRKGLFDISLENYEKAKAIFEKHESTEEIGITTIEIGNIMLERGDYNGAVRMYKRAQELLAGSDNQWELARINNNLGHALVNLEQYKDAIALFKNEVKLGRRLEDSFWIGWGNFQLAECYAHLDELGKARESCTEAMEILTRSEDRLGLAKAEFTLGLIHWYEGDEEQAFREFEGSIGKLEVLGVPGTVAYYIYHYGRILKISQQDHKARRQFAKALQLFKKVGAVYYVKKIEELFSR